jgi:hypothetical protein
VRHSQHPAGGDPSASPGVGTCVPGAAAGGTDRRCHHGVGGRGEGPHVHGVATAGGAADGGLLPTEPPVYPLRRVSGARLADWDGRRGRGVWTPRERSHGAGRDALDPRRRPGGARPAGGADQSIGIRMAVPSAPTTSAVVWPVRHSAGVGRNPRTGVGCLINRLSTNFGHTPHAGHANTNALHRPETRSGSHPQALLCRL